MLISLARSVPMRPERRIVIASAGVAGWMTASALARSISPAQWSIHVLDEGQDDDSLGVSVAAEPTLPATPAWHAALGYDENALICGAGATFSLGIAQTGWNGSTAPAFCPFGDIGAAIGPVAFHQLVAKARHSGADIKLTNYALAALCAQADRFARPAADDRSVHASLMYGLNLRLSDYAEMLRADALAHGVTQTSTGIAAVQTGPDGLISALITDEGAPVAGDLFIDCTGPRAALISTRPGAGMIDWSHWLPCDRALDFTHRSGTTALFSHTQAHAAGWQRFVPLQDSMQCTHVYASAAQSDAQALSMCAAPFARIQHFVSGRQNIAWQGNCVAIGGAAAVIDPLAATAVHLAQSAISQLITLLPSEPSAQAEATEFNRAMAEIYDGARDFAILSYKLNRRARDPFWQQCQAMAVPERLAHKIALYESCGRIALHDGESFDANSWICQFEALGLRPRRYDALADSIPDASLHAHFTQVRNLMLGAVARMPTHAAYIAHIRHPNRTGLL